MLETQSTCHVVHSDIEVKFWLEAMPSVDRVRPSRCPRCGVAARAIGHRLEVVGHGARERQVRGCPAADEGPAQLVVRVRRYRCLRCSAVITVVPAGVARRRHFGAGAIGLALACFGGGEPACTVRDRVGGLGPPEERGWVTLRRWIRASGSGALFPRLRPVPGPSNRHRAARAAQILSSYAAPALARTPLEQQVFAGAMVLARAA